MKTHRSSLTPHLTDLYLPPLMLRNSPPTFYDSGYQSTPPLCTWIKISFMQQKTVISSSLNTQSKKTNKQTYKVTVLKKKNQETAIIIPL